jgi:hypothetical protein
LNECVLRRSKHSRVILKAYRFFLLGQLEALEYVDISESEMTKMRKFHEKLKGGNSFYITGRALCFTESISRGLWHMFQDYEQGKEIRDLYPSNETRPRVARVYKHILCGMSKKELQDIGFTEYEIEKANLFRKYEACDMFAVAISQKIDLAVSTVKRLQRLYQDNINTSTGDSMKGRIELGVLV